MNVNQFHNLEHAVGTRFLEYVLNYQGELVRHHQLDEYEFTDHQLAGAGQLLSLLAMSYAASPGLPLMSYPHLIGEFNRIRQVCGASPQNATATTDPILGYLLKRAVECYPIMLLKEDERGMTTWGGSGFSRLPISIAEANDIAGLLKADSALRTLLQGDGEAFMMRVEYALDVSLRVSSSPLNFCDDFLHGAFAISCYRGKYALTDFLNAIESGLEMLRAIASGNKVQVSYFRGIYGMRVDSNVVHHLGCDTTLRNIGDLANPQTQGTMSMGTNEARSGILLGCVLEHAQPATRVPIDDSVQNWTNSWTHFERLVDDLVMSVVLSGKHKRAPIGKTFTDIYAPLYRHHSGLRENVRGGITCLNREDLESVTNWFLLLSAVDVRRVRIPLGRVRAALYERTNPVDALLDFFVAWESMFSTKVSTTNSVVRSMEAMLKRTNKSITRKRLSELYGLRSKLVHGSSDDKTHPELLTLQAQESVRDEACEVALVVLSELLKDNELLQLEPQQRVSRLLNPTEVKCDHCNQLGLRFN